MSSNVTVRESRLETKSDPLRVDQVIDSRHKYVSATPRVVMVEHAGQEHRLLLPDHCPDCDFILSSAVGDLLFLIGRQRPASDCGAVVVARKREDGVYTTELWHETYRPFVKPVHRGDRRSASTRRAEKVSGTL